MYRQPVHLDYLAERPAAEVPFVPAKFLVGGKLGAGVPEGTSLLAPGTEFDVLLKLRVPEIEANREIFQITAKLMTANGTVIFTNSRPVLVTQRSPYVATLRTFLAAPLVLLGLRAEEEYVEVPIMEAIRQQRVQRAAVLEVGVGRRGRPPPQIAAAEALVVLRLGWFVNMLYRYPLSSTFALTALIFACLLYCAAGGAVLYYLLRPPGPEARAGARDSEDTDRGSEGKGSGDDAFSSGEEWGGGGAETPTAVTAQDTLIEARMRLPVSRGPSEEGLRMRSSLT